jgi:hypothetical protein
VLDVKVFNRAGGLRLSQPASWTVVWLRLLLGDAVVAGCGARILRLDVSGP